MKKIIVLLLFLLASINIVAQNKVTKASVKQIFRKSKDKLKDGSFSYPTDNCWNFVNDMDSLYFKKDTLVGMFYKSGKRKRICEAVTWTFHSNNELVIHKESLCKEPPTFSAPKYPDDYFWIAIYEVEKEIMIDFLRKNDRMIMESFKVVSLEVSDEYNKIVLQRRFIPY